MTVQVLLVRPWTDAHAGGGCCGGDARDGICLDGRTTTPARHDAATTVIAQTYLHLRERLPDVDVQVVSTSNSAYLLPTVFRAVRRRHGTWAAVRHTNAATRPGSVVVDGVRVGDVTRLGAEGTLIEVLEHARGRTRRAAG